MIRPKFPVSVSILHFPKFDTKLLIPVGELSGATCSLLESGLSVGFLFLCEWNGKGVQVWRPLASANLSVLALREGQ